MAWTGGQVPTAGLTGAFLTQLATQTASSGVPQALGQVWQGAGQSFFGSAGQALGGALAGSAINIALNSAFGTDVVGPQGLSLTSGANILASTITPYVTSSVAAGINQNIQKSLQSAGPFGPILSNLGTSVVNQATQGITNAIFGAATPGNPDAPNYIMFPGADENDPDMSNRNSRYTLEDIVFSLKRANQGPQSEGDAQAQNAPTTGTTVTTNQVAGADNLPSGPNSSGTDPLSPVTSQAKAEAMGQAPLRDQPLWESDGDMRETPLFGGSPSSSGIVRDPNRPGEYTETFDPAIAQRSGTRQAGYLRRINAFGVDPSNVRAVINSDAIFGGGERYIGYIDKYGNRQPWPYGQPRPTPNQTGTSLF